MHLDALIARIAATPARNKIRIVALVGAPASGKSTLAQAISAHDPSVSVVPMDGFHLDNPLLEKRGLLARKGSPDSFDALGLVHLLRRFAAGERPIYPTFDRVTDRSIAGAGEVSETCETVLVEGNYLLLDKPQWRDLKSLWDLTIQVDVPRDILRIRLLERWRGFGFSDAEATAKTEGNDLPNADFVLQNSSAPDVRVDTIALMP
ncbi:MAG: nucleoside/nucleotide kinase family protein [Roseobacter sp.]